jgi:hypothetical protein
VFQVEISSVTSAKRHGKSIRVMGTWDIDESLLYSQGYKNFKTKDGCSFCSLKKPMMKRFAIAKKGETPQFSKESFCGAECYRKFINKQESRVALQGDVPGW